MKPTADDLIMAFTRARKAAQEHASVPDEGTANTDRVALFTGRRKTALMAAAAEAGVSAYESEWFGRKCLFLSFGDGQGFRRTKTAEAACEVLTAHGLDAMMFYQRD